MSNISSDNSYSNILRSTSLFGGVQVLNILISVVKSKFVAIFLGPTGIGIVSLLTSTTGLVNTITNFSLSRSSVKSIAAVNFESDPVRISKTITVLRKLVWITGSLGALGMFAFSSSLSSLTFGNEEFSIAFMWISITLLFNQMSESNIALLRGMRQLKKLAKSTLLSSLCGLLISIPIYIYLGIEGIVPVIIFSSIAALIVSYFFSRSLKIKPIKISKNEFASLSREMMVIGFFLTISSIISLSSSYGINLFIRAIGNINDVGFYNAGFTIVNSYFGVIFISLTTDYYPKLAAIANQNLKAINLMNEQSEMTLLLIAPILVVFLVFCNFIIEILYTKEFLVIENMILWASFGIYLKAISWAVGVIFISKGDTKYILLTELGSNLTLILFSMLGYQNYGLEGLGISFFISFFCMLVLTYTIVRLKYGFKYSKNFYKIVAVQLSIGLLTFVLSRFGNIEFRYMVGTLLIFLSIGYSYYKINQVIDLKNLIAKFLNKS